MPDRQIAAPGPKTSRGPSPRQRAERLKAGFLARLRAKWTADKAFEIRRWNAPETYDPKLNFLEVIGTGLDKRAQRDHMTALRMLEAEGEVEVITRELHGSNLVSNPFWGRRASGTGPQRANWRVVHYSESQIQIRLLRPQGNLIPRANILPEATRSQA